MTRSDGYRELGRLRPSAGRTPWLLREQPRNRLALLITTLLATLTLFHIVRLYGRTPILLDEPEHDQWGELAQKVILSRKTGYSVVFHRIPMHLMEPRPDIPHQYIYSDSALRLGDVPVIDILANVSDTVKAQDEFQGYELIHQAIREGTPPDNGWPLWDLDRYKFLPLLGDMYRRHPDADWFVSADGDTYIFWSTLLRFLSRYDPHDQLFFGQKDNHGLNGAGNTVWANGGAGYVLSKGVMAQTYAKDPWGFENHWDTVLQESPGGDVALARAIYRTPGITLNNSLSGGSPM